MIRNLSKTANLVLGLPRSIKRGIVLLVDLCICWLTVQMAFYLRTGNVPELMASGHVFLFALSVMLAIPIFVGMGMYRAIFRYSGLPAMLTLAQAMLIYAVLYAAVVGAIGASVIFLVFVSLLVGPDNSLCAWINSATRRSAVFRSLNLTMFLLPECSL